METFHKEIVACYLYIITRHGYPPDAAKSLEYLHEFKDLDYSSIELEGIREEHLNGVHALGSRISAEAGEDISNRHTADATAIRNRVSSMTIPSCSVG